MRGPYPGELRLRVITSLKPEDRDVRRLNNSKSVPVRQSAGCNAFAKMEFANQCPVAGAVPPWRSIHSRSSS